MQRSVLFARFPGNQVEHPATTDWLVETVLKAKADLRIRDVFHWRISDTPITMGRNLALEHAKKVGADWVLMVDADMHPDLYLGRDPRAVPFWDAAVDFLAQHNGPAMLGAPYCGPPPHENVYVFQWAKAQSDHPNTDLRLEQVSREEAAARGGIEEVGALPTGLVLLDMRALERLQPPYFDYEWQDATQSQKASTEDVVFTRNLSLAGVPLYCLWDSWAGHYKLKCVGKPVPLSVDAVRQQLREAVLRNQPVAERRVIVGEGQNPGTPSLPVRLNGHRTLLEQALADVLP
jgi:hypothetical protein